MVDQVNGYIFTNEIAAEDKSISSANTELLRPYITSDNRSLVFFVGAGTSLAGNTGMPSTSSLLFRLLVQAFSKSGQFTPEHNDLTIVLNDISSRLGFEITLNDFWQICRRATGYLYEALNDVERDCSTNRVHTFLAYWLSTGGTVLTTNYDRLIERQWGKMSSPIQSRYKTTGSNSFLDWEQELNQGSTLFKIHGSLDEPDSCLGALEHVGMQLVGVKADLLTKIVETTPLCFVGWRGVDPDIPPLLYKTFSQRDSSLPIFWLHYEGYPPNFTTLENALRECSLLIQPLASQHPILSDADRIFGGFLEWIGIPTLPNSKRKPNSIDFTKAIGSCTKTGLRRMVGIALRRSAKYKEAEQVLNIALELSETPGERAAALQEIALLKQQLTGRETDQAQQSLCLARKALKVTPDPRLQLNTNFGLLSMSIINIKSRPWLSLVIPGLFRKYRASIELLRHQGIDEQSVALHESLLYLYRGRLRFKLFGWLATLIGPLADWIIAPFDFARSHIDQAKEISLHSRIDVLGYRAVALAYLRRCRDIKQDLDEVSRLIMLLKDDARTQHWSKQRDVIQHHCNLVEIILPSF